MQTQWEQVLELGIYEAVSNYYSTLSFPITVRWENPQWLEYYVIQLGQSANPDNPQDAQMFETFMSSFFGNLRVWAHSLLETAIQNNNPQSKSTALELQAEICRLARTFHENATGFYRIIKSCLDYEIELIKQKLAIMNDGMNDAMDVGHQQSYQLPTTQQGPPTITARYNDLEHRINRVVMGGMEPTYIGEITRSYQQIQNNIIEISNLRGELGEIEAEIVEARALYPQPNGIIYGPLQELQQRQMMKQNGFFEMLATLKRNFTDFGSTVRNTVNTLKIFVDELIDMIDEWKLDQHRAANGCNMTHSLVRISSLAKTLVSGISELSRRIQILQRISECLRENGETTQEATEIYNEFKVELNHLLCMMVCKTFVVETQPPQILRLKSTIKQDIKVQLLVGSSLIPSSSLKVTAHLIDKGEVERLHDNPFYQPKPAMSLQGNEMPMCMIRDKFSANFAGITLPGNRKDSKDTATKKGEKKDSENELVPRKKYCFYFYTTYSDQDLGGFTIWTTSIPVIVTVNPCQYEDAWATILWDNAFCQPKRRGFEVPKEVDAKELIEALSNVFKLQTRREFSLTQKEFLLQKLMGNASGPVTWKMFAEDKIECVRSRKPEEAKNSKSNDPVTFHIWLYAIKKLCVSSSKDDSFLEFSKETKKCCKENTSIPSHWVSKNIEGFITKDLLVERLRNTKYGTFMLYFSEAILGSLTVAWYNHSEGKVQKFVPYEIHDLKGQSLEDRILSAEFLVNLYPDVPKESVFKRPIDVSKEFNARKWDLIEKGYIWVTQQQVPETLEHIPGRKSNASLSSMNSNSSSTYGIYGSPRLSSPWVGSHLSPAESSGYDSSPGHQRTGNESGDEESSRL